MRYISIGSDEQLERLEIPIKFVTAERNAVPIAARKYTATVGGHCKKIDICELNNKINNYNYGQERTRNSSL
jgi:hypothetical protein